MKRLVLSLMFLGLLSSSLYASNQKVASCVVKRYKDANSVMQCTGDFNGESTLLKMYKDGWVLISSSMGALFIFEK